MGNKNLKLREVIIELVESKLQGEHLDYYTDIWEEFDLNHDGVLDTLEFTNFWNAVKYPKDAKKPGVEEIIALVDIDMSGNVDFDEFVAFTFDIKKLDAKV